MRNTTRIPNFPIKLKSTLPSIATARREQSHCTSIRRARSFKARRCVRFPYRTLQEIIDMTIDDLDLLYHWAALHGVRIDMALDELDLLYKRWRLSEYTREFNEREGLDTPEKRLEALGARMKAAKAAEAARVAAEREAA